VYRHILVPIDGSASSTTVADHAFELAAQLGAEVTVLHVLDELTVPFVQYGMEPYVDVEAVSVEVIEAQRRASGDLVADIAGRAPQGLAVTTQVVESAGRRTAESIVQAAAEAGADLIVMGTHGHRGLSRMFLGSVADGVIRSADVPVTMVRVTDPD
jgi:nucleotide-binding universal stress UspA family protein